MALSKVLLAVICALGCLVGTVSDGRVAGASSSSVKILVVGDSISDYMGDALSAELSLQNVVVYDHGKPSSGLSNSWFYDWPAQLRTFLALDKPNYVVVLGGSQTCDRWM